MPVLPQHLRPRCCRSASRAGLERGRSQGSRRGREAQGELLARIFFRRRGSYSDKESERERVGGIVPKKKKYFRRQEYLPFPVSQSQSYSSHHLIQRYFLHTFHALMIASAHSRAVHAFPLLPHRSQIDSVIRYYGNSGIE